MSRDNVYLYSRYSGRIEMYLGSVRPFTRYNGQFTFKRGGKNAYLQCSLDPGVVHHGVVWLQERDDDKARELFIEHEELAIQELKEKIERREWNIKLLKETREKQSI